MGRKGRRGCGSTVHRNAVCHRCLMFLLPFTTQLQLHVRPSKLRNEPFREYPGQQGWREDRVVEDRRRGALLSDREVTGLRSFSNAALTSNHGGVVACGAGNECVSDKPPIRTSGKRLQCLLAYASPEPQGSIADLDEAASAADGTRGR
jgi:hypothetical protein